MITIGIVTFNSEKFIYNLLYELLNNELSFEIIIFDNNSKDNTLLEIDKLNDKRINLIKNDKNSGFGYGCNQISFQSNFSDLFFLNPDIQVEKSFLPQLFNIIIKTNYDCFYIKDLNDPDYYSIDVFGTTYSTTNVKKNFLLYGGAFFIKKKIFHKIGCFDESYFLYSEDIDLSWRLHLLGYSVNKINLNYKHFSGGSSNISTNLLNNKSLNIDQFRRYEVEKNTIQTLIKNYSFISLMLFIPFYFLINLFECIFILFFYRKNLFFTHFKSYKWVYFNLANILKKRKKIQSLRKVSDIKILSKMNSFFPNKFRLALKFLNSKP